MSGPETDFQQTYPEQPVSFQPSEDQIARATALQRFNRLHIYLPLGLVATIVIILSLVLLYLAIFPPAEEETWIVLSGIADFILILWLIPVVLIFGIILLASIGGTVYYKYIMDDAQKPLPPAPEYGRLRTLLWRLDSRIVWLLPKLREGEGKIARPIIRLNAWFAYIEAWLDHLKLLILRR